MHIFLYCMSIILLTIIGGVIAMALGWAWHGPLFGKKYMESVGVTMTPELMQQGKKTMGWYMGIGFLLNLVMAFVFFNLLGAFGAFDAGISLRTTIIVFIGFIFPMFTSAILWDGHSPKQQKLHFAISFGYYLVLFVIWALVFAWLG